jgi:sRNA-binding regulator protein Hfq
MINELADYKASQKKVKIYFGQNFSVSGEILELSHEHIIINSDGKPVVVSMKHIVYFQEG